MVSPQTIRFSNDKFLGSPQGQPSPERPAPFSEHAPAGDDGLVQWMAHLDRRIDTVEALLKELLQQRMTKDRYTTTEVAEIAGKSEYTVREWCRKGQIEAEKAANGRGWLISHQELTGIQNGERPLPEVKEDRSGNR